MKKLDLAYLAGCMDSDGYFSIRVDAHAVRHGRSLSPSFSEMMGLRQVTPEVPQALKEAFGGSLYITQSSAPNGRPLHSWHVMSRKAATAASLLLPYLRIKPAQAKVLLELQALKSKRAPGQLTAAVIEERQRLVAKVKALNKRGL